MYVSQYFEQKFTLLQEFKLKELAHRIIVIIYHKIVMENLSLPDEIILKILGYLSLGELIQCARVSKRLSTICNDDSLSYTSNMLAMKDLTVKDRKSVIDILIARPEVREVTISWKGDPKTDYRRNLITMMRNPRAILAMGALLPIGAVGPPKALRGGVKRKRVKSTGSLKAEEASESSSRFVFYISGYHLLFVLM